MSGLRAGTYSIVARDPATGELGVAVQSHWFSVGSIVTWARPGVGAVATQSVAEPAYGPRLLDRLAAGEDPAAALAAELAADDSARFRQVAAIDAAGRLAAHTGDGCMDFAGHSTGDGVQRPGEHDGLRGGVAGDGDGVRGRRRPARAPVAGRARGGRGGRGRRARQAVGGAARRPERGRARGGRRSSCGSRTLPSRSASCGGCSTSTTPTRSPTAPTRSRARAATTRRPSSTGGPPRRRRRASSSASGPGSGSPRRAISTRARGGSAEAIEAEDGWRALLSRFEPEIAPSAGGRPRRARGPEGLEDDGALARAVVEVDQDELLPGASAGRPPITGTTSDAPTIEARWWAWSSCRG